MFLRSGTEKNWLSLSDNLFLSPITVSEPSLCQLLSLSPLSSWLRRLDCVMNAYGTWPWIDGILLMFPVVVPLKKTSGFLMNTLPGSHMISVWPARLQPQWHTGLSPCALIIFLLHICNTTPMLFWKYYLTLCASMNTSLSKWSKVRKCLWFLSKLPALSWSCMS